MNELSIDQLLYKLKDDLSLARGLIEDLDHAIRALKLDPGKYPDNYVIHCDSTLKDCREKFEAMEHEFNRFVHAIKREMH